MITLSVVNAEKLPAGASRSFRPGSGAVFIGRDGRADWTLPDPSLHVSGRHCEIRFHEGAFWLRDISTNGTFLNGSSEKLARPHRLADGDRLTIGPYQIAVMVERQGAGPGHAAPRASTTDHWGFGHAPAGNGVRLGGPAPAPQAPAAPRAGSNFLETFCAGAGLPPGSLSAKDEAALAFEIGQFVQRAAEGLGSMLKGRARTKALVKSANRTVIGTEGNNPLKYVPSAAEAVAVMFAPNRPGYLDARRSLEDAFSDLRIHEAATFAAMQTALARLLEPLSPDAVEAKASASAFSSRKARAWDLFVERWEEAEKGENGLLDTFLRHFAEAYDEASARLAAEPREGG